MLPVGMMRKGEFKVAPFSPRGNGQAHNNIRSLAQIRCPVRPLDQHNCSVVVEQAKLFDFSGFRQPVQIGVQHLCCTSRVRQHQKESWRWHFQLFISCKAADYGAGEGRLASTQITLQKHQITRTQRVGN